MTDEEYMREALAEAALAAAEGEVPIGAVLVAEGVIIARAHNRRETCLDATAHAELLVIREACRVLQSWRLSGAALYVTLEPCPMCAGAIVNSRVGKVVYGCRDSKAGGVESRFNILSHSGLNHRAQVRGGVCEEECAKILKDFFRVKRQKD